MSVLHPLLFLATLTTVAIGQATCLPAEDWPSTIQIGHKGYETALVQSLINEINDKPVLAIDGDFGNRTMAAVKAFQTANTLSSDGIVGPQTWKKLFQSCERYLIEFNIETGVVDSAATPENDALYECKVSRRLIDQNGIGNASEFRGSILPDNLDVKGRINDGFYILHLGLHKRRGLIPTTDDLRVKTTGTLRPCIVVGMDANVPVTSNDPNKTTSNAIHIHNGFNTERGSEGCQTITPSLWANFITHFLNKYQALDNWSTPANRYRGRELGLLVVK